MSNCNPQRSKPQYSFKVSFLLQKEGAGSITPLGGGVYPPENTAYRELWLEISKRKSIKRKSCSVRAEYESKKERKKTLEALLSSACQKEIDKRRQRHCKCERAK